MLLCLGQLDMLKKRGESKVSNGGKISVIVTLSGRLELDSDSDMTAAQVLDSVSQKWGIDLKKIDKPFVVVHDQMMAKYRTVEGDSTLGNVDGLREVVRAVLPLVEE